MHIYKQKQAERLCRYLGSDEHKKFLNLLTHQNDNMLDSISHDLRKEVESHNVNIKSNVKKQKLEEKDIMPEDSISCYSSSFPVHERKVVKTIALKALLKKKHGFIEPKSKKTITTKKTTVLPILLNKKYESCLIQNDIKPKVNKLPIYLKKLEKIKKIQKINEGLKELSKLKSKTDDYGTINCTDSKSLRSISLDNFQEDGNYFKLLVYYILFYFT